MWIRTEMQTVLRTRWLSRPGLAVTDRREPTPERISRIRRPASGRRTLSCRPVDPGPVRGGSRPRSSCRNWCAWQESNLRPSDQKLLARLSCDAHLFTHFDPLEQLAADASRREESCPVATGRRLLSSVHELDAVTLILEVKRLPAVLFAFLLDGRSCPQGDDHQIPRSGSGV